MSVTTAAKLMLMDILLMKAGFLWVAVWYRPQQKSHQLLFFCLVKNK